MLLLCLQGKWRGAHDVSAALLQRGYTPLDIVLTSRSVLMRFEDECKEHLLIEFVKVSLSLYLSFSMDTWQAEES